MIACHVFTIERFPNILSMLVIFVGNVLTVDEELSKMLLSVGGESLEIVLLSLHD